MKKKKDIKKAEQIAIQILIKSTNNGKFNSKTINN